MHFIKPEYQNLNMDSNVVNSYMRVCSSDKTIPIYILRLCKVWSLLHHGSVG